VSSPGEKEAGLAEKDGSQPPDIELGSDDPRIGKPRLTLRGDAWICGLPLAATIASLILAIVLNRPIGEMGTAAVICAFLTGWGFGYVVAGRHHSEFISENRELHKEVIRESKEKSELARLVLKQPLSSEASEEEE
jgi:hypothetical protein